MIFGIGTDIIQIPRIEKILTKHPTLFIDKYFSNIELEKYKDKKLSTQQLASKLAKFFAAKEAFVKALDDTAINYTQIEVLHNENGKPYINITPYIFSILREHFKSRIEISISHCKDYATAVVLVE